MYTVSEVPSYVVTAWCQAPSLRGAEAVNVRSLVWPQVCRLAPPAPSQSPNS